MEPFIDGGLFEILVMGVSSALLNYVFSHRVILAIFSLISIMSPVLLFFIRRSEVYNYLVALCLFNAIFLFALLWKTKSEKAGAPLFNFHYKQLLRKLSPRKEFKRL
jgi:hypothetical protein